MTELIYFKKKSDTISAVQWDGTYLHAIQLELELGIKTLGMTSNPTNNTCSWWKISTLENGHVVSPFDWIITGVKGDHYPCKPDIFMMTYEHVLSIKQTEHNIKLVPIHQLFTADGNQVCDTGYNSCHFYVVALTPNHIASCNHCQRGIPDNKPHRLCPVLK